MDRARFDRLARTFAASSNRRTAMKGIASLAIGGIAARAGTQTAGAAWSTLVCLPGPEGVVARLVPTAAVPFYVARYGAVVAENGVCPECLPPCPLFTTCSGGACVDPCTLLDCSCSGFPPAGCLRYADGTADCMGEDWGLECSETMANCTSDAICVTEAGPGYRCAIAEGGPGDDCFGYPNTCQITDPIVCSA